MTIHPFKAVVPDLTKINADDAFFETVKEKYITYCQKQLFLTTSENAIYLYQIETPTQQHYGVVASLSLNDYRAGKIKKHEKTLIEKEKKQMELLLERGAMVKPVLLTHLDNDFLRNTILNWTSQKPVFYSIFFEKSEETHRFWKIADSTEIAQLQDIFQKEIPKCYVADGHHRLAANLHFEEMSGAKDINDDVLCAFFATSDLRIEAFNRFIENVDVLGLEFIKKLEQIANPLSHKEITPNKKGRFGTWINEEYTLWEWKAETIIAFQKEGKIVLDVDILNEMVFKKILSIEDIRKDKRINYIEGNWGDDYLRKKSNSGITFSLYPVNIQDLIAVSEANGIMPPKSTWFEPRMKNGLLVQEIS
jgi:uncharacterized protein (DUF1015 family)